MDFISSISIIYGNTNSYCVNKKIAHLNYSVPFVQKFQHSLDGLVQDHGNASANTLALPQSCTKPSIYWITFIITGPQQVQTIVLTALLLSVHNKSDLLPHPDSGDFTTLPVLLVKGAVTLARPLCTWLEVGCDLLYIETLLPGISSGIWPSLSPCTVINQVLLISHLQAWISTSNCPVFE